MIVVIPVDNSGIFSVYKTSYITKRLIMTSNNTNLFFCKLDSQYRIVYHIL